jgi:hypothetical protein
MSESTKNYPIEFDRWIREKDLMCINGIWQIFQDEEKDWTPFADTIEELFEMFKKETGYKDA